jgi:hypothetical protein
MFYDTQVIDNILRDVPIPKMIKVKQIFERYGIKDISLAIKDALNKKKVSSVIKPGMKICIACGSRGIANLPLIVKEIADFVKKRGGYPFIIPAMGSHGGATAEGQKKVLMQLGVTEDSCGCPIISSMDTVEIAKTASGEPIFVDKHAASPNGIIVVGRIKPHTDFQAKYESGLMKMLAVGLGKHKGAEIVHKKGAENVGAMVEQLGTYVLKHLPVLFGVALVENAYDETKVISILTKDEIKVHEPELLKLAYASMARLLIKDIDLLIVDEIGKEISGTGADPNVTGSFASDIKKEGVSRPSKIIFLDLTDATDGSAVGIGLADITTMRLFNKIDFAKTYANSITTTLLNGSKIPIVMQNDIQAIKLGIYSSNCDDFSRARIVRIKNTLQLSEIFVSESLYSEVQENPQLEILQGAKAMSFDEAGNIAAFEQS